MLIAFNKPFGVLSQFSGEGRTLADYINVPDVYPAGQLDKDSEGLMLLTDHCAVERSLRVNCYNRLNARDPSTRYARSG